MGGSGGWSDKTKVILKSIQIEFKFKLKLKVELGKRILTTHLS